MKLEVKYSQLHCHFNKAKQICKTENFADDTNHLCLSNSIKRTEETGQC